MQIRSFVVCVAVVVAATTVALARPAEHVVPGQKLFGELAPDQSYTVLVDGTAGMKWSAKCKAYKGTTLRLDVALADPDGVPVVLGTLKKTNATSSQVSINGLVLARTGSYRLTVTSVNATQGGFDLATAGVAPKKLAGTGTIAAAGETVVVPFAALPGDRALLTVKPAKRSSLKPLIHRFVDAGGAEQLIDAAKQASPVTVTTTGTSRFEVTGGPSTTGAFTWSVKFTRAKAPKTARDVAELDAAGDVTGVIVLDGQTSRSSVGRVAKGSRTSRSPDIRAGEVVVSMPAAKSRAEVELAAAAALPGTRCTVKAALAETGPYLVEIEHLARASDVRRAKSATRALAKSAAAAGPMEWCVPNGLATAYTDPNDPRYPEQFHLRYLRLPNVWNRTEGSASIVIAVIDTGYVPHPDLTSQLLPGYDFIFDTGSSGDGDGWDPTPIDANYDLHGTHVAGIIGARSNNKSGVAGVVWQTKILPVRVLGKNGGSFFEVAAGLRWAVGLPVPDAPLNPNPARVVNMSLGAAYDDQVMRFAVAEVHTKTDAVIVAAAGNEGSSARCYPAAYPGVIPVHALDANLSWASYSNFGDWISVGAPGGDPYRGQAGILSTFFDTVTGKANYAELSGTSMACPQIAGVAALMIAVKPTLTRVEIRDVLQKTALDLGPPGFDIDFGWGMVNAEAAIDYVLTPFASPNAIEVAPSSLSFEGVSNQSGVFVRTKVATPVTISQITPTMDQSAGWLTVEADRMVTPATLTVTIDPALDAGTYTGKIRLTTSAGVVDVPVHVVRAPRPKLNFVVVSAVAEDGRVVAQATTSEAKSWAYTLSSVPLGRYRITAFADTNSNLELDRVDEWEGVWPIRTQPSFLDVTTDSLDGSDVNVPLERYDARFGFRGVGSGRVVGAVAVHATDAVTGRPVAAARVHLGGGPTLTLTDARGRAVFVGGFSGGQTVSVVADGYGPMTRIGADAQFQAFALVPLAPGPTVTATATIRGLQPSDRDVYVQIGDAKGKVVYDGVNDPAVTLTCSNTGEPLPVSVAVFDPTGTPTRSALYEVDTLPAAFDVATTLLPIGGAQARFVQPTLGTGSFLTTGSTLGATTYLRWNNATWVAVGDSPLVFNQSRQGWWADPGQFTPALPMKFEVLARDTAGRELRQVFYGSTVDLQTPIGTGAFTFAAAPSLSAPAAGAQNVAAAPTLTWSATTGASLHRVAIEETGTSWRWTVWVAGVSNQIQIPSLPAGGLKPATNYRWSVETYRFGAGTFDNSAYREERLETDPASRVFSGWSTFRTQ